MDTDETGTRHQKIESELIKLLSSGPPQTIDELHEQLSSSLIGLTRADTRTTLLRSTAIRSVARNTFALIPVQGSRQPPLPPQKPPLRGARSAPTTGSTISTVLVRPGTTDENTAAVPDSAPAPRTQLAPPTRPKPQPDAPASPAPLSHPKQALENPVPEEWPSDTKITREATETSNRILRSYQENPHYVDEHYGIERSIAEGGYGRRQLYELIQNGSDAALDGGASQARIEVVLTEGALYCANEGAGITPEGLRAIMHSHLSAKRADQIGRFGLGFKSVLAVTNSPQFFSRTGSFGFDGPRSARTIGQAIGPTEDRRLPILRLAFPLDPQSESRADPQLARLMAWATTVIRLPLNRIGADHLADDIRRFPIEFMLFSDHVGTLRLIDRPNGVHRHIQCQQDGDLHALTEGKTTQRWRVCRTTYHLTETARKTAGELAERDVLPIVWAAPVASVAGRGRFWAFFPSEYETTARGILNAPWKMNEDRQNLLRDQPINDEMLERAAALIVDNLPLLTRPDDPAAHLDYLPAQRETVNWADEVLSNAIYAACLDAKCIPDLDGVLQRPSDVRLMPIFRGARGHSTEPPREALELFRQHCPDRAWTHPSAESGYRRSRVEARLYTNQRAYTVGGWLSAVLQPATVEASAVALRIASILHHEGITGWEDVPFVLCQDGQWAPADSETVYFPPDDDASGGGDGIARFVADELVRDPSARSDLQTLGIEVFNAEGAFEAFLATAPAAPTEVDWEQFWTLARRTSDPSSKEAIDRHLPNSARVRTVSGHWLPIWEVLLPGKIVSADRDPQCTIDVDYHYADLGLLRMLGLKERPEVEQHSDGDPRTTPFVKEQIRLLIKEIKDREPKRRPRREHFDVSSPATYVGPWLKLDVLSTESRANLVEAILTSGQELQPWEFRHDSQPEKYRKRTTLNPSLRWVKAAGVLPTSLGRRRLEDTVGPTLHQYRSILPVVEVEPNVAEQLDLPGTIEEIPTQSWVTQIGSIATTDDPELFGQILQLASRALGDLASSLELDIGRCALATDDNAVSTLTSLGYRVAQVAESEVEVIARRFHLTPASKLLSDTVRAHGEREPIAACDLFPDLEAISFDAQDLEVVGCEEIEIERRVGDHVERRSVPSAERDGVLLLTEELMADERRVLQALLDHLQINDVGPDEFEQLLHSRAKRLDRQRLRLVEAAETPADKLLAALGRTVLETRLPEALLEAVTGSGSIQLEDRKIAELALAVHGVEILRELREDLRVSGFDAPKRWAGGRQARAFVRRLGFDTAYAGFPGNQRDPLVEVPGRPLLHPLHGFQQHAADNIRDLLRQGQGRGLLSLPTGAGKTRTAVQALVEAMIDEELDGPILWVAQSDELCEQAVVAWSQVWSAMGTHEPLSISRLWASNEAEDLDRRLHVVVATIQKLDKLDIEEYGWLQSPGAVVVDEAHRSTGGSYQSLLRWMGMGRGVDRVPLIGLTATPFRGTSEDESLRLVRQYAGRRFDQLGEDPYGQLQNMGVLADVRHHLIEGSRISLTDQERQHLTNFRRLPESALARLGKQSQRNEALLADIATQAAQSTVLVFATSVEHANVLAGMLTVRGIPAQAISAKTDRGARKYYIEQFRRGEIRVLTNYNVLAEGFDAPAVGAVYIARPTFSPSLYQQMLGRGLRGPANGGSEECLVVNVADNIDAYGERLAFQEFEYLWNR